MQVVTGGKLKGIRKLKMVNLFFATIIVVMLALLIATTTGGMEASRVEASGTRALRPCLNSSGIHSGEGFHRSFSATFQTAIVPVTIPYKHWEEGNDYSTQNRVFIPSTTELGDTVHNWSSPIDTVYPFFFRASYAERVAHLGGTNWLYWTRSPESSCGYGVRRINSAGDFDGDGAGNITCSVRPALNLKSEILVSEIKNADGPYELFTTAQNPDPSDPDNPVVPSGEYSVGLYDYSDGVFHLKGVTPYRYGPRNSSWHPLSGDWNGSGPNKGGLYDSSDGVFHLEGVTPYRYGPRNLSWQPVAGDWNSDGVYKTGLYDPVDGVFHLEGITPYRYGPRNSSWQPIAGDWNGDGLCNVGLYDPSDGVFHLEDKVPFRFGPRNSDWLPVTGDWNGDGSVSVALYDQVDGVYHLFPDSSFRFGPRNRNWYPLAGKWTVEVIVVESKTTTVTPTEGGSIELSSGAKVIIPAGAFSASEEVTLSHLDFEIDETDVASPLYRISGLPEGISAPLELILPLEALGPWGTETYIVAQGRNMYRPSGDSTGLGRIMLLSEVTEELAFATLTEDQAESLLSLSDMRLASNQDKTGSGTIQIHAQTGQLSLSTEGYAADRFNIIVSRQLVHNHTDVYYTIRRSLENSFRFIEDNVGLSFDDGPNPIPVYIFEFNSGWFSGGREEDAWGYAELGRSRNSDYISLNARKLGDPDANNQFRATAAHELFHLFQQLYVQNREDHGWLQEAAATWIEFEMSNDPAFWPQVINQEDVSWFLMNGMLRPHATQANSIDEHGYAASLFLQHMTKYKGKAAMGELWKSLKEGESVENAFWAAFDSWYWYLEWVGFAQSLFRGDYTKPLVAHDPAFNTWSLFVDARPGGGIWTVDDLYEGEKEKEFTTTLHPLAAKAFTVQLRYHEQGFKEGDDGTLVITDQNENCRTRLQVFERLADNEVQLLGTATYGKPWRLYNLAERGQATLGIVAVSDWDPYGAPDQACPVSFKIDLELKELVTPVHNITQDTWHEYIHEAINEAVDGDELVVSPGSYRGSFSFAGKSITLRSEEGPEKTTLFTTSGSVVNFVSGENNDAVLSGFTVGGIRVGESDNGNAASPTIKDNIISPSGTSGITIFNGSPIITDNVIETSSYYLYNGIHIIGDTSALISGNTISGNGSSGIGIFGNGSPTIINNTIKNRNSHGIHLWGGSPVISGNVISGNSGRGIFADSTTCTITDNTISDNVGGGIWTYENDASIITGNRITNNDGSGVEVNPGSSPTINNNEITGNTASRGGGIMIWSSELPVISGNTISGNHATDRGGGIYGLAAGWVKFEEVTVGGNPENVRRHSPPFEEPDNTYSGNTHGKQFGSWGPGEDNWCEDAGYDVYIP